MGKRNKLQKGGLSRKNHLTVIKSKKTASQPVNMSIESEEEVHNQSNIKEPSKPKPLRHRRTITKVVLSRGQKRRAEKREKFARRYV
jgi:hypothetical protein